MDIKIDTYTSAKFIDDVIVKIFNENITSEKYRELHTRDDRNLFYRIVESNTKYLNEDYALALKKLVLKHIKNAEKKEKLFRYFKDHLTIDVVDLINKNSNVEKIVNLAISKFLHPNNNFLENEEIKKQFFIEFTEIYLKTIRYLKDDRDAANEYLKKFITEIIEYIIKNEDIKLNKKDIQNIRLNEILHKKIINGIKYQKIMSETILFFIENLYNNSKKMLCINDNFIEYKKLLDIIFLQMKTIVEWFVKDYLDSTDQFSILDHKVKNIISDESKKMKLYDTDKLLKIGWSYRKIAETLNKFIWENIDVGDYSTDIDLFVERIKCCDTRRIFLDSENNVIGVWQFMSVVDSVFKNIKTKGVKSGQMTPNNIRELVPNNIYNIYFGIAALKLEYRRKITSFKLFFYSILEYIEMLAMNGIFINQIFTDSSTSDGKSLIETTGLKYCGKHENGKSNLYHAEMESLIKEPYLKDFELLRKLYREEYPKIKSLIENKNKR